MQDPEANELLVMQVGWQVCKIVACLLAQARDSVIQKPRD